LRLTEPPIPIPLKWASNHSKTGTSTLQWLQAAKDRHVVIVTPNQDGYPILSGSDFSFEPRTPEDLAKFLLDGGRWLTVSNSHELASVWKLFPSDVCKAIFQFSPESKKSGIYHEGYYWRTLGKEDSLRVSKGSTQHGYLSNVNGLMPPSFKRTPPGISDWAERFFQVLIDNDIPDIGNISSRGATGAGLLDSISPEAAINFKPSDRSGYSRKVLSMALLADKGGRSEAFKLGFQPHAWQYDISSAYAAALKDLPCVCNRCCTWTDSKEFQEDADYGFALCEVDQQLGIVGVATYRAKVSRHIDNGYGLTWPFGIYNTVLGLPEMRLMKELGHKFTVLDGVWAYSRKDNHNPCQRVIDIIFKMTVANPDIAFSFKAARNAMIGGFRSVYGETAGAHFNPIYSAHIKAIVRANVTRLGHKYQDSLIRMSTDGLSFTKPLPDSELGDDPGSFRLEGEPGQSMTLLTDYFADRPGKTPRWRKTLESLPPDAIEFTVTIDTFNGLGVFANYPSDEAWDKLGRCEQASWGVPLGSGVRETDPGTVGDYLVHSIETTQLHIQKVYEDQSLAALAAIFDGMEDVLDRLDIE